MLRRIIALPFAIFWTALIPGLAAVVGMLTLGQAAHLLVHHFARVWGRGVLWLFGVRLRVVGEEHLYPVRSRIFVINHTSVMDMFALAAVGLPAQASMVKKEFRYIPFLGQAIWATGQVFVDRGNRETARLAVDKVAKMAARHPRTVLIFPEGTRTRDGKLQRFKMGAFHLGAQTGLPLIPAVIHGAYDLSPPGRWGANAGDITIVIYPERSTAQWEAGNLRQVANDLREEYLAWLAAGPPPENAP